MKLKVTNGKEKFKELIENKFLAIHCPTEEQAIEYCTVMDAIGECWCSGNSYFDFSNWDRYKAETCYSPFGNGYGYVGFYEGDSKNPYSEFFCVTVVEWEQIKFYCELTFEGEATEMTLEEICQALGKNIKIVAEQKMKLCFKDKYDRERFMCEISSLEEARQEIYTFLYRCNYKSYYCREWVEDGVRHFDVGSHTEEFLLYLN